MSLPPRLIFLFALSALPCATAGPLADRAAAAEAKGETFVEAPAAFRFLPSELRFADKLSSPDISTMAEPAVAAIADFASQLKEAGTSLAVVPVPPKVLVQGASSGFSGDEQKAMRVGWEKIMADLSAQGVQVVDLLADFLQAKEPVFCLRDTHWSGHGINVAVTRLLPSLQAAGIPVKTEIGKQPWKEIVINGDLGGEPEGVELRFPQAFTSGQPSPVLLLGDSHVLVFHQGGDLHATGAGLPEQLADVLGNLPEVMGVRGSGATSSRLQLARRVRSAPGYLGSKKMIVWVFAGREFTEADAWKKIPVVPAKSGR